MEQHPHSRLGIASFIISIAAGILIFMLVVIAGVMEASAPGGMDEDSPAAVMIGLFIFALLGASLVALCLGIAGVLQADRNRVFAILGTLFSVGSFLFTIFIMILGLTAE